MTPSKLNVAYSFSWLLPSGDTAQVRAIIESLRQFAIELGSEEVGPVVMLTGEDAQAVRSDCDQVIMFTTTIPNTTAERGPQNFGLGFSSEEKAWTWSGVVRASSFREISAQMVHAASLGISVSTILAGMIMEYQKNAQGVIEVKQRPAIDWTDF
ncbi:MAG: hypothetical protein U0941_16005 [Planctomycetaceae bacterium]